MRSVWLVMVVVFATTPALATEATPEAPPSAASGADADPEVEKPPHIVGPKHVDLAPGLELALPFDMELYEKAAAQEMLKAGGDPYQNVVGIVVHPGSTWSIVISWVESGYVSDADAAQLDAAVLLGQIKQATSEQNKIREARGMPALEIDAWTSPPRYEIATNQLVWGLAGHDVNGKVVNFNTRLLGRYGFASVNIIDAPENMPTAISEGLAVLQATRFKDGYRYIDFEPGDRESGMSLTGLIVGGAGVAVAKKAGLLAALVLFLKKGWILVVAALAGIAKLFRRKRDSVVSTIDEAPPPDAPPPAT